HFQEVEVAGEVGHLEGRHPGLLEAEELPRATDLHVLLGEGEAVGDLGEGVEPLAGLRGGGLADGDADGGLCPAAYAPPKLVELVDRIALVGRDDAGRDLLAARRQARDRGYV